MSRSYAINPTAEPVEVTVAGKVIGTVPGRPPKARLLREALRLGIDPGTTEGQLQLILEVVVPWLREELGPAGARVDIDDDDLLGLAEVVAGDTDPS